MQENCGEQYRKSILVSSWNACDDFYFTHFFFIFLFFELIIFNLLKVIFFLG